MDDELLQMAIRRLREDEGDPSAWEMLYRVLYPFVLGSFFRMLGANRYLAEECLQEVMMRLLRNLRFERKDVTVASLMQYVKQTVRSVAVDLWRRETVAAKTMVGLEEQDQEEAESALKGEGELALQTRLEQAIRLLPEREATIIRFLVKGASADDLAVELQVSKKTAYNLASESRKRLRQILFPTGN